MWKAFVTAQCPCLEVYKTSAPFHVGMSELLGSPAFVSNVLHQCICIKVFSKHGGVKQTKKGACSLFLFLLRSCRVSDFLWFVEQAYSAGDVPQKYTH